MVGDSEIDIAAGKACSMRTIAVTHGYGRPGFEKEADFAINGLLPLIPLVKNLP
jgi:phosphoglycolate phosphatase-like HAD superfamily hydrolase